MSSQYGGKVSNVSYVGQKAISSMSGNGVNPILCTTSSPHLFNTGDFVDVVDIDGNTAANGQWQVTVTDATHFTIPTTGNGTYTATPGGFAQSLAFGSTFQIPSDGDTFNAASVNVGFQGLADRTAGLTAFSSAYKLAKLIPVPLVDNTFATNNQWSVAVTAGNTIFSATKITTLTGILSTDFIEMTFAGTASFTASAGLGLAVSNYFPNAAPPAPTRVGGSAQLFVPQAAGTQTSMVNLTAIVSGALLSVNGRLDVYFSGYSPVTVTINIEKESFFIAKVWRTTGIPQ